MLDDPESGVVVDVGSEAGSGQHGYVLSVRCSCEEAREGEAGEC